MTETEMPTRLSVLSVLSEEEKANLRQWHVRLIRRLEYAERIAEERNAAFDSQRADIMSKGPVLYVPRNVIPARPLSYAAHPITRPRARAADPDTSHQAAATVQHVTRTQERIRTLLRMYGQATDEELFRRWSEAPDEQYPPISPSGLRSRRHELEQMGKVVDTGSAAEPPAAAMQSCGGLLMAECRSCHAPLEWVVTTGGKRMPIDAQPNELGNLAVRREAGGRLTARPLSAEHPLLPDEKPAMSHFATCPNASQHRKDR